MKGGSYRHLLPEGAEVPEGSEEMDSDGRLREGDPANRSRANGTESTRKRSIRGRMRPGRSGSRRPFETYAAQTRARRKGGAVIHLSTARIILSKMQKNTNFDPES